MKKIIFWLVMIIVIFTSSFILVIVFQKANTKRLNLSKNYYESATNTNNTDQKLLLLIKSDTLASSSDKKVEIALLYLAKNQPEKAEKYLIFADDQRGNLLLAEYYLLKKPEMADKYLGRITDQDERDELSAFKTILSAEDTSYQFDKPKTDLGFLIKAISNQEYSQLTRHPILIEVNGIIPNSLNHNDQTMALAKYFLSINQPRLAIFTLNNLENYTGKIPETHYIKAQAYLKLNKVQKALREIDSAIAAAPEKRAYYIYGINLAQKANDKTKLDFLTEKLKELDFLQS